jgi:hypothetical protein
MPPGRPILVFGLGPLESIATSEMTMIEPRSGASTIRRVDWRRSVTARDGGLDSVTETLNHWRRLRSPIDPDLREASVRMCNRVP